MTLDLKTERWKSAGAIKYTNSTGSTITAGTPLLVAGRVAIPMSDIADGASDEVELAGRFRGIKADETWDVGDIIGWDADGNPKVGTAGTGCWTKNSANWDAGYVGGTVIEAALAADQYGYFALGDSGPTVGVVGGGLKMAAGIHTSVDADDTVVTGLDKVIGVVAQLDSDPVDGAMHATATIGDQAGAPAAGSINIKTWKTTDADATLIASTTFGKLVSWIAFGY